MLDLSKKLKLDEKRCAKWQHILTHMSSFPTLPYGNETVFRLCEKIQ